MLQNDQMSQMNQMNHLLHYYLRFQMYPQSPMYH
jgi:hypothetical protein